MTNAQKKLLNKITRYQEANFRLWNTGAAMSSTYRYGEPKHEIGAKCISKAAKINGAISAWLQMLNEGLI